MKKPKKFELVLSYSEAVTAYYAVVNYIAILRAEIVRPTRDHGPAELAAALADAEPLRVKLVEAIDSLQSVR